MIKPPEKVEKEIRTVSIPKLLLAELDEYAAAIGATASYVICESLKETFNDKAWKNRKAPENVEKIRATA